ncbi:GDSL-type esterase/lipase family protein [Deinococcus indicus]|nr:GDSL-type esterase/lipase family protein [Deinococcus indicus]
MAKIANSTSIIINCEGDSLTYGQDTSATGTTAGTNGSAITRSATPYPETLAGALSFVLGRTTTVVNRGFPGDRTTEGLTRWANATGGDITILMYGTNDAKNYGGYPSGTVPIPVYQQQLSQLIDRRIAQGQQVIVLAPPPVLNQGNNRLIRAYGEAARIVADRYGVPFIDTLSLLRGLPDDEIWTDNVHLSKYAYNQIAWNIAMHLGTNGARPPRVGPGDTILPQQMHHNGGTLITRTPISGGVPGRATLRLTAGQVAVIPLDVAAPCRVIADCYSGGTEGIGTVQMYYFGAGSKVANRFTTIPTAGNGMTPALGHVLPAGVRGVIVGCASGIIEIAQLRLVRADTTPTLLTAGQSSAVTRPDVAGVSVTAPAATWAHVLDTRSVITTLADGSSSTARTARITARLQGSTGNALYGLAFAAARRPFLPAFGLTSGYIVVRVGTTVEIREFTNSAITASAAGAGAFTTGVSGELWDVEFDGANVRVYIDGTLRATLASSLFRHFHPGLVAYEGTVTCYSMSFPDVTG